MKKITDKLYNQLITILPKEIVDDVAFQDIFIQSREEEKEFPNGFNSWCNTHAEMIKCISFAYITGNPIIEGIQSEQGHAGLHRLAQQWTDEFELLYKGHEWDGEYIDEINSFQARKLSESEGIEL